jgi:Inner membrane component of T3SS, cytoplasmic domain
MSFRLFVYYCAVGGAWSGFVGWFLGRSIGGLLTPIPTSDDYLPYILRISLIGMFLGFAVAFGLSFLDAVFSITLRQPGKVFVRVVAAVIIGVIGGVVGSFVGGSLFYWTRWSVFFILSWTIVGFLIGMSICFFELFTTFLAGRDFAGAVKKFIKCLIGGTVGGILGGTIAFALRFIAEAITKNEVESLWTPTALGFVAIGACIGLLVGLAQIILMEAWIKVEAGFRPGRQMILSKAKTSIGRGEGSDIALFGDSGVEKAHANIVLDNGRYYLEDLQTPGGSFVNDQKVAGRAALKAGDMIRVGKSVLRFDERAKRK